VPEPAGELTVFRNDAGSAAVRERWSTRHTPERVPAFVSARLLWGLAQP
jgi:hypothetical protein